LPSNISEDTAKELLRISQQHSNSLGNLGELCTEFLDATAVKNSEYDDCLISVFHKPSSIMLQFIYLAQSSFCICGGSEATNGRRCEIHFLGDEKSNAPI